MGDFAGKNVTEFGIVVTIMLSLLYFLFKYVWPFMQKLPMEMEEKHEVQIEKIEKSHSEDINQLVASIDKLRETVSVQTEHIQGLTEIVAKHHATMVAKFLPKELEEDSIVRSVQQNPNYKFDRGHRR